jgi:glucose 1-dehydrogenase
MNAARALEGQCALVTGGSTGIGAAICRAFAAAGAHVGINYRESAEDAQSVARAIEAGGGHALTLKADVASEAQVQAMFASFAAEFGRIDILVANAGIQIDAPVTEMTREQWDRVIAVNLTGEFLCAREAVRRFLAQGRSPRSKALGKIVCMSSVHEIIPWAGHINYVASKGGIAMMMRTLAQEVAGRGIRVNAIAPGAIATPINRPAWEDPEARARLLRLIPYGRIGTPEDVARAALWLACDDSDYVVGTTLFIDGGMSLYPEFVGNG